MDKYQCKKYIKKAYCNIKEQNKTLTIENLEKEIRRQIEKDAGIYIDCAKIALNNLSHSANDISEKDLIGQVDVILKIYDERQIILKANKLQ